MAMTVENDEQIKALSGADPIALGADIAPKCWWGWTLGLWIENRDNPWKHYEMQWNWPSSLNFMPKGEGGRQERGKDSG